MNFSQEMINVLIAQHILNCSLKFTPIKRLSGEVIGREVSCQCDDGRNHGHDKLHDFINDERYGQIILTESRKRSDKPLLHFEITLPRAGVFRVSATPFEVKPKDNTAYAKSLSFAAALSILSAWNLIDKENDTIDIAPNKLGESVEAAQAMSET